jgi:hypothetical protein
MKEKEIISGGINNKNKQKQQRGEINWTPETYSIFKKAKLFSGHRLISSWFNRTGNHLFLFFRIVLYLDESCTEHIFHRGFPNEVLFHIIIILNRV